jgi:hypothetical protein
MGSCGWVVAGVLCAGACGRIGFGDESEEAGPPALCGQVVAVPPPVPDADVDLSFVPTDTGVTAFWNLRAGSELFGINLTDDFAPDTMTTASPVLAIDLIYQRHAATFLAGELMVAPTTAMDPVQTYIKIMVRDLSGYVQPGVLGGFALDAPYTLFGAELSLFLLDGTGLVRHQLDGTWTPTGTVSTLDLAAGIGAAAASVDDTELQIVSSTNQCRIGWRREGLESPPMQPCMAPRIAAKDRDVAAVFERTDGVHVARGPVAGSLSVARLGAGDSARIVHDGARYWIAFRQSGRLVVGYLAGTTLWSIDAGPAPGPSAFELAVVDFLPVLATVTGDGLVVRTLCIP